MSQDIAQQTEVEYGALNHLIVALRTALAWKVHGSEFSRKLSTLRFVVRSFERTWNAYLHWKSTTATWTL